MNRYRAIFRFSAAAAAVALIGAGAASCGVGGQGPVLAADADETGEISGALAVEPWMVNFNPCEPAELENPSRMMARLADVLATCKGVVDTDKLAQFRNRASSRSECFLDSLYWVCHRAVEGNGTVSQIFNGQASICDAGKKCTELHAKACPDGPYTNQMANAWSIYREVVHQCEIIGSGGGSWGNECRARNQSCEGGDPCENGYQLYTCPDLFWPAAVMMAPLAFLRRRRRGVPRG